MCATILFKDSSLQLPPDTTALVVLMGTLSCKGGWKMER